jgi:hypothetical protein
MDTLYRISEQESSPMYDIYGKLLKNPRARMIGQRDQFIG